MVFGISIIVWLMIGLTAISESESRLLSDVFLIAFGGVQPSGQIHVMGLFRWIGSLLPCITIALIGFKRSMFHIVYTLPRLRKANIWWRQKIIAIWVWCGLYFAVGLLVTGLLSLPFKVIWDGFPFSIFLYPFMLFNCVMILCSVSMFFSQTVTISLFTAVWGITAILGNKADQFIPAFFGCYGMALQIINFADFITVAIVQTIIIIVLWIIGGSLLKSSFDHKRADC